jgi:hypothetical protein
MSFDIVSREWAMRAAALELVNYERPAWALTIARDTEPRMSLYPRWIFRVYITCTSLGIRFAHLRSVTSVLTRAAASVDIESGPPRRITQ